MAKSVLTDPRPPSDDLPTKAERLAAELELAEAEEAYAVLKAEGLARVADERAAAFTKAGSWQEYHQAIESIAKPVPAAASDKLRNLRSNYRRDWRRPVAPGEGAAAGVIEGNAEVLEPN